MAPPRRFPRLSVNAQPYGEAPPRELSRTIPPLGRLCPGRYADGADYGQVIEPVRIPPNEGRTVRLGSGAGAERAVVHVMSTPVRPTLSQMRREAPGLCDPGYIVTTESGETLAVNARQVRELERRPREGLCPYHRRITRELLDRVDAMLAESFASGAHPRDAKVARDLPFPHRKGSSPCCEACEVTPEKVLAKVAAWRRGGGSERLTRAQLLELATRAIPRGSDIPTPRTLADIDRAMLAVRDHCWQVWARRLADAEAPRKEKFVRLKADVRSRYTAKRPPK